MSSSRSDPGATIAARGQRRAPPPRDSLPTLDRTRVTPPGPRGRATMPAVLAWTGLAAITIVVSSAVAVRSANAVEILEEDETAAEPGPKGSAAPSWPSSPRTTNTATKTSKPATPRASAAELQTATTSGTEALGQLAQRFPEDPAVLKALFLAQAAEKKTYSVALRTARRLIELSADTAGDADFRAALVNIANGPSDTSAVALDVMVSEMGARGGELLFEVATGTSLMAKAKAAALLKDPEIRRNASPGLILAADLLEARPCARKPLFERAKREGDARALPLLKPLLNTVCGGGPGGIRGFFGASGKPAPECYRCFTPAEREQIQAAIDAIEARSPDASAPK
ncbi:Hypothetical protein A7982_01444 [Minicystis rosea]|nr:Hypothetical protein A7982_01444 [Minicystis rosea]